MGGTETCRGSTAVCVPSGNASGPVQGSKPRIMDGSIYLHSLDCHGLVEQGLLLIQAPVRLWILSKVCTPSFSCSKGLHPHRQLLHNVSAAFCEAFARFVMITARACAQVHVAFIYHHIPL